MEGFDKVDVGKGGRNLRNKLSQGPKAGLLVGGITDEGGQNVDNPLVVEMLCEFGEVWADYSANSGIGEHEFIEEFVEGFNGFFKVLIGEGEHFE